MKMTRWMAFFLSLILALFFSSAFLPAEDESNAESGTNGEIATSGEKPTVPPIPKMANPTAIHLQRTLKALTESTAEHPAHIRVLFYGQSIVAQGWTGTVMKRMKEAWPTVEFEFHNAAIGGYTSPSLVRTAEYDLYPWYPDLLFFHVYGPIEQYEEIVRKTRERTSAEIVLWTSHLRGNDDPASMIAERDQRTNDIFGVAERQKCMVIDLNWKWAHFLLEKGWPATKLVGDDGIHLNSEGCDCYAQFIFEELVRLPGAEGEPDVSGTIEEIDLSSDRVQKGENGELILSFDGNRVTAVSDGSAPEGTESEILLDGEAMNGRPELWAVTRPSNGPVWMPAINNITWESVPVKEDWTLSAMEGSAEDGSMMKFRVEGSLTGPDGEGSTEERFVSRSGRVVIEPSDFGITWQFPYFKTPLPPDFKVTWSSYPLFADPYVASPAGTRTVLVQNCENGPHTLTIRPNGEKSGIAKFIVNTPAKR